MATTNSTLSRRTVGRTRPSSTVSTRKRFNRWDYPVFYSLTALNLAALGYFLIYWFGLADWGHYPLLYLILTGGLLLNLGLWYGRWLFLPKMRVPEAMPARPGWKVGVATTFVPGSESLAMLEETVRALLRIDYPHVTWVLDEGDDPAVKALCMRLGAYHFSRKHRQQYQTAKGTFAARTKHGNYNAWLDAVGYQQYDLVATFDPDHIPQRDFLTQLVGYFADPGVAYVQAAQAYYNQSSSFIARGAAEETYAYYSSIQMTSYAMGYAIVTGCHTVQRTLALRDVGGFAAHEADDLLITVLYRARGWRGVYVPKILAKGLTPVDWSSYLTQQRRWARSVLDVKFRIYPKVAQHLPRVERLISLVHGLYYLQGLNTAVQIGVLAWMLGTGITPRVLSPLSIPRFALLLAILQICEWYRQRFFLDPKREWGLHLCGGLVQWAKWPYILLALFDALTQRFGNYTITRKVRTGRKHYMLLMPFSIVITIISTAWLVGFTANRISNPMLHWSAAFMICCSLAVIATEFMRYPDPYDPSLLRD